MRPDLDHRVFMTQPSRRSGFSAPDFARVSTPDSTPYSTPDSTGRMSDDPSARLRGSTADPLFALVDCNNFYVSCERVFRPELRGRAVIILSSNDGCAIARSNEAKALGIDMGVPVFKIRDLIRRHDIRVISGNLALYGDMSGRVMSVLRDAVPRVEIYSIDEAFLDLSLFPEEEAAVFCSEIRSRVLQWTGIPTSIGIAPTKTLAKAANRYAKKHATDTGVHAILCHRDRVRTLAATPLADVWGIGKKLSQRFEAIGCRSGLDLAQLPRDRVASMASVVTQRTHLELNGVPALELEDAVEPRKQIISSRSFASEIDDLGILHQAVSSFVGRAAEKLRRDGRLAGSISVYIHTNPFRGGPQWNVADTASLTTPSDDTLLLCRIAGRLLDGLWRPGFGIKKAGVLLSDLVDPADVQRDLFSDLLATPDTSQNTAVGDLQMGVSDATVSVGERRTRLMSTIDNLNTRYGRGSISVGVPPRTSTISSRSGHRSPSFTTRWSDIPVID